MKLIDTIFKNVKPESLKWLGLGAVAGSVFSVLSTYAGWNLSPWLSTVVGLGVGGFLVAESSVKGFSMPKTWKGFVHLGSFIAGLGVLLVTLLPLIGITPMMAIATAAAWASVFVAAELFV